MRSCDSLKQLDRLALAERLQADLADQQVALRTVPSSSTLLRCLIQE